MTELWGQYLTAIRTTLLGAEDGNSDWSDEDIAQFVAWAQDDFAHHTPYIAEVILDATVTNPDTALPYDTSSDDLYHYDADPYPSTQLVSQYAGVYVEQSDIWTQINEGFSFTDKGVEFDTPPASDVMLRYYAYYPKPDVLLPNAPMLVPRWALSALKHRILSYALIPSSIDTASIRQFATKRDSGNPEHNPLLEVQQWQERMYEALISKYQPLERKQL